MQIVYRKEVEPYLFELIETLYEKEYFGFHESATTYVTNLRKAIEETLPIAVRKKSTRLFLALRQRDVVYSRANEK